MTIAIAKPETVVVQGDSPDPRWARTGLLALLTATAVLYLWGLGSSGWANSYYAAAAQAGTQSWKAWLFGSFDAGNAVTVDKPPAAMWVMVLSGRLFGFNAFTMLLPQALMGVAAVAVLYYTVRRCSGPGAGLVAGTVLALTPVAALMFRYNNPDALLVLLLIVAAYCALRATESGSTRWMALTGCVVGLAFLTKMLQAFLIVPGLALAFLVAAPTGIWKRLGTLLVGGATLIASAGWYVALVSLWPTGSRPYIAGSTDNSLLQLALGYNGIQRIVGRDGTPGGHGGPPPGMPEGAGGPGGNGFFGGDPGIGRLFGASMGTEASWLLPAAIIGLAVGLWLTRRAARTDRLRASLLLWGGWLVVTGAVFSFMDGTVHPYYTVALAPAIAALVGISVVELLRRKETAMARITLAVMLLATGGWAFVLLGRTPDWFPALRWVVLVGSIGVAVVLVIRVHRLGRATLAVAVAAALFGLGGSAAYAVETVARVQQGPMATSGPGRHADFGRGGHDGFGAQSDNAALEALVKGADNRWAAAGIGSFTAGSLELKTGSSVMAIGGFTGGDPSPTLAQFQQYVTDGQVRYFIVDDRGGPGGPGGPGGHREGTVANDITTWVEQNFTKKDVGGTTVYDLESPRS